jgi:hypothetical protein
LILVTGFVSLFALIVFSVFGYIGNTNDVYLKKIADSPTLKEALIYWLPLVMERGDTPRFAIKFQNRTRYLVALLETLKEKGFAVNLSVERLVELAAISQYFGGDEPARKFWRYARQQERGSKDTTLDYDEALSLASNYSKFSKSSIVPSSDELDDFSKLRA